MLLWQPIVKTITNNITVQRLVTHSDKISVCDTEPSDNYLHFSGYGSISFEGNDKTYASTHHALNNLHLCWT